MRGPRYLVWIHNNKKLDCMIDFLKDNAVWLTPVLVAVVSGVFYLIKKGGKSNKQTIKDVKDSTIYQAGGDIEKK